MTTRIKTTEEDVLRKTLLESLDGRNAHLTFKSTVKDFPPEYYNEKVDGIEYSCWGLIEHMRIAQSDILDFINNPEYKEREWPASYWPTKAADKESWGKSIQQFLADENKIREYLTNDTVNLFDPIPHAPQYNIYREILILLNHNSYHTGQLLMLRKALGLWPIEKPK